MVWAQQANPLNYLWLSALVASLPVLIIFWALAVRKMKGHKASILGAIVAIVLAIVVYKMPVKLALLSAANGILYGLFPICWIIINIIFLFNMTVESGQFEVIKQTLADITPDRRLQALLIAFSFGAFLEGIAGFGAPIAITAALLVGLGFDAFYAAGICLIANTAPVAFGAVGIPITVAAEVSGVPEMAISQMVGRTLPFLAAAIPFYLIFLIAGFKKSVEVLPAILVSGLSFALLQWASSNYLGASLPDIIAGIGSVICLTVFLKIWKPRKNWYFPNEQQEQAKKRKTVYSGTEIFRAWSPFIVLTITIMFWGIKPVKDILDAWGSVKFSVPGIDQEIQGVDGELIPHVFNFNYLSSPGTAILLAAITSVWLIGIKPKEALKIFFKTLKQLKYPIVTISVILGFAYVVNDSGITLTIAMALAGTGFLYPLFAPVLGWLGTFVTGSDTSSNALFGKLQLETATSIGVDPLVTVASNTNGGVVGKMISPQSIAVGTASVGLTGKEGQLFRFTFKHSLLMLAFLCLAAFGQAYWLKWMVPHYTLGDGEAMAAAGNSLGVYYILILVVIVILILFFANKKKSGKHN